jgi:hypothetical protein
MNSKMLLQCSSAKVNKGFSYKTHPLIRSQKRALRVRSKKLGAGFKGRRSTPEN